MSDVTIEKLQLEVNSNSQNAVSGIDALSASLSKLKTSIKGGVGLSSVARQITNLNTALNGMDSGSANKIDKLATSLSKLSSLGQLKISSSIGNQLKNIGQVAENLNTSDFSGLSKLGTALAPLTNIQTGGLNKTINALKKFPEVAAALNGVNWTQFTQQMMTLSNSLAPLATQLNTVSAGMSRLPSNINRVANSTNNAARANNTAAKSYVNLWAKARMAMNVMRGAVNAIASWITESNKYIEDLNLFSASLGDYADEAKKYAEQVGEVMGIDPAEWMRNQGIFNTIIKGFGVASDRAYLMSKNLTQLGYDISSFYNISYEDAFTKLQSGIAGELEPLRRLGYDLSVARLQQEAYTLGIEKKVSAMTQAEKSELRYYAIMTQVTTAQGDMARTLNAPANQLRVLKAQVVQCARALGNIFIPVLNAVLPYAIALAKVLRMVANAIASFFGFKLPEVDYSSLSNGASAVGDLAGNADDASDGLDKASKAAKKLKNNLLGIDELNIISPDNDDSSGSGSGAGAGLGGGGLGIELPSYDFLGDLVSSKVDGIIEKMKEWLGLTEEINSWSDFFHTRLGHILTTVGAIGLGLAAWKVSKGVIDALQWVNMLKGYGLTNPLTIAIGISLLITGVSLETAGIIDAIKNALDGENFAQIVSGGILSVGGGAFLGKGIAGWITTAFADSAVAGALETAAANLGLGSAGAAGAALGAGVMGIIAGLPMYFTGIWDAINEGLNWLNGILIPTGSTLASAGIGAIIGACGGPIGAGIGALIGLAVGLVTDGVIAITEHWEEIKTFFHNFFTVTIPGIWNDFVAWLKGLPETIRERWTNLLQPIKDFDWKDFGYECGQKVGGAVKSIGEAFKKFFTETLPEVWETVKTDFKTFFTETLPKFFTETIPELWETIKTDFVTFFTETLPEALSNIGEWFLDVGQAIWDGIVEGWNTAIKAISDFIKGFVDGFKEALGIHSPSTVFRDEVGVYLGEGLLAGLAKPFDAIGEWVKKNIIDPISNFIKDNPISDLVVNIKNNASEWWSKAKSWWNENAGEGISIEAFVSLVKSGWTTVKNWIGNIPTLDQAIKLIKQGWTTVKNWVGNIPVLDQAIKLIKQGWNTVAGWIGNIPAVSQAISLAKSGWDTVSSWVSKSVGSAVSIGVSLVKNGWNSIKEFFGLSSGGYDTGHGFKLFANGGYVNGGRSGYWGIPAYGNGGITHGSLFVAGEAGTEMVGRIGGQTEVLNQSQIKLAMRSAVISGMSAFTPILSAINSNIVTCSNAVINSVITGAQVLYNGIENVDTYDPTNTLSNTTYEDAVTAYRNGVNDENMYSSMRDFYREFVEPTLKDIAADTKRQADKEENINVQVGNRDITRAVDIQREANGYSFT